MVHKVCFRKNTTSLAVTRSWQRIIRRILKRNLNCQKVNLAGKL